MDFLKSQIARIQEQLAGLSATQKMLTVSLLAIMVMTLMWWSHWAAEPEMEPVLDQPLSQEDLGQITANLDGRGITHKVVGDRVLVPADRKLEILSELGFSQALPRNFDAGFDDLVKQIGIFDSPEKSERVYLEAKNRMLSEVIRYFPGVTNAIVAIDPTSERRFDNTAVQPSAMVTITTDHSGRASAKQMAKSAAAIVSGAQAGLLRSRINIVIDAIPYTVPDKEEDNGALGGDDILDMQRQREEFYRDKIRAEFQDIPNLLVSVTVNLNTASRLTMTHEVDPKKFVSVPETSEDQSEQTMGQTASATQEPGAVPNVAESVPGDNGGGGGGGTTSETNKSTFETDHYKSDTTLKQGPGDATVVAASVRVPRSHFVQAYRVEHGGKDPDEATLQALAATELTHIRQDVKACTSIASDDAIVVGLYDDAMPTEPVADLPTSSPPVTSLMRGHIKEIGVGVLAMVSLFMVSMMVRKGAPAPAPMTVLPAEPTEPRDLSAGEGIVGNVGQGNTALDGMELDEDAVKAQQMLDQVQQMVQTNPEAAAGLVKRWLNRS
jgi:flagellar biosynthesis/type III secretory pathway M-ring protein FliF/YscJ